MSRQWLLLRFILPALLFGWFSGGPASAEWYAGGYGGLSSAGSLKDVTMPLIGQRIAEQQFPQANSPLDIQGRGTLTQSFKTSDLSLKSAAIFGGKLGYFFTKEKLPWLGIELEAFTSKPTIKTQSVATDHEMTFQPNTPDTAANCALALPPNPNICPAYARNKSALGIQESDLRVMAVALNVIARYPGTMFQPYVGAGAGAFYFSSSSGSIQGRQWAPGLNALAGVKLLVTDEWGLFAEGKYNLANLSNFDPTFGVSGMYSVFHLVAGISYHF